jgi:hypothetical protein
MGTRSRTLAAWLVVTAVVATLAAAAYADGTLSVVVKRPVVSYPQAARLVVTTPAAVAETITVEARPVGGDWSVVKTIPAARAAVGTTFTVMPRLNASSDLRAIQAGVESDVATVGVKALLGPVSIMRTRGGGWTLRGTIAPAHAPDASITVKVWLQTATGRGRNRTAQLTPLPDITANVFRTKSRVSWYKTTYTPATAGTYAFMALDSDTAHVESFSRLSIARFCR